MNDFINLRTSKRQVFYFITLLLRFYYALLRMPGISAFVLFWDPILPQNHRGSSFNAKPG